MHSIPFSDKRYTHDLWNSVTSNEQDDVENVHEALNFLSWNTPGLPVKLEDGTPTKEGTTESGQNILESMHPASSKRSTY